jgi:hypothetical protein
MLVSLSGAIVLKAAVLCTVLIALVQTGISFKKTALGSAINFHGKVQRVLPVVWLNLLKRTIYCKTRLEVMLM